MVADLVDLLQPILLAAIWCWLGYSVGKGRKQPKPDDTFEKFGRRIGDSALKVRDARRFTGPGMEASVTHTLRFDDGREVKIIVREDA